MPPSPAVPNQSVPVKLRQIGLIPENPLFLDSFNIASRKTDGSGFIGMVSQIPGSVERDIYLKSSRPILGIGLIIYNHIPLETDNTVDPLGFGTPPSVVISH